MPEIGQNISHYSIVGKIGKGGMGEVFRAKDLKLGRDVAIKVLPDEFARDADRVARFQREAKLLASLNHPNIAAIYGLEESGETNFLVLELVEGDTLADRIKAGPIPIEEALKLALQIAEALEAAHEKGVIHRDLKPANIKVTPDGKVKVLDFGLAKAFAGEQAELNLSNSPTLSNAATQQGVILGTAAYMSPEQARGKAVDKRADIWAFGCVLYEMLTGHAAFNGKDVTDILASVIRSEPDWNKLPENLHWRIRESLERCLEKEAKDRYGVISDARVDIQKSLTDPKGALVQPVTRVEHRTRLRTLLPWLAATVVLTATIAGVAVWNLRKPEPRQVMRFDYELPEGQQFNGLLPALAISPDGKHLAYTTLKGIYLRSMDELTAKLIPGTEENPQQPFFSPDGKWIGYFSVTDNKLKKFSVSGGAPVTLCDTTLPLGVSWNEDNTIVFNQAMGEIMRISANGGTPELLIKAKAGGVVFPQILPGGGSVLFEAFTDVRHPRIAVQSLKSGEIKELFAGRAARYLPTGHIVYGLQDNNNLFAIPFNLDRLEVAGGPVPIVEGVLNGHHYAISDSGTLVYIPGIEIHSSPVQRTLVWVDRNGKEEPIAAQPNQYKDPNISPDGTKVAIGVVTGTNRDIWIWDLVRQTLTRLTFNANDLAPVWAPDGKRIAFVSVRAGDYGVYWKAADGTGNDELLRSWSFPGLGFPACWSGDRKMLIDFELSPEARAAGNFEIGALSMDSDRKWRTLLKGKYNEAQPRVSPDGRWMAYTSNESGQNQIYVRPFPNVDKGRWQVSAAGGDSPLWSPDGRELFYRSGDAVMAVTVKADPTFSLETPRILFRGTYVSSGIDVRAPEESNPWDISPDGKRFLMMKEAGTSMSTEGGPRKINIVVNWFEELKQRVPVK
jgi:serine/threonine-protein kinase